MRVTQTTAVVLPLLVILIVGTTLFLAVKNNQTDSVYSLSGIIVGYYFGRRGEGSADAALESEVSK